MAYQRSNRHVTSPLTSIESPPRRYLLQRDTRGEKRVLVEDSSGNVYANFPTTCGLSRAWPNAISGHRSLSTLDPPSNWERQSTSPYEHDGSCSYQEWNIDGAQVKHKTLSTGRRTTAAAAIQTGSSMFPHLSEDKKNSHGGSHSCPSISTSSFGNALKKSQKMLCSCCREWFEPVSYHEDESSDVSTLPTDRAYYNNITHCLKVGKRNSPALSMKSPSDAQCKKCEELLQQRIINTIFSNYEAIYHHEECWYQPPRMSLESNVKRRKGKIINHEAQCCGNPILPSYEDSMRWNDDQTILCSNFATVPAMEVPAQWDADEGCCQSHNPDCQCCKCQAGPDYDGPMLLKENGSFCEAENGDDIHCACADHVSDCERALLASVNGESCEEENNDSQGWFSLDLQKSWETSVQLNDSQRFYFGVDDFTECAPETLSINKCVSCELEFNSFSCCLSNEETPPETLRSCQKVSDPARPKHSECTNVVCKKRNCLKFDGRNTEVDGNNVSYAIEKCLFEDGNVERDGNVFRWTADKREANGAADDSEGTGEDITFGSEVEDLSEVEGISKVEDSEKKDMKQKSASRNEKGSVCDDLKDKKSKDETDTYRNFLSANDKRRGTKRGEKRDLLGGIKKKENKRIVQDIQANDDRVITDTNVKKSEDEANYQTDSWGNTDDEIYQKRSMTERFQTWSGSDGEISKRLSINKASQTEIRRVAYKETNQMRSMNEMTQTEYWSYVNKERYQDEGINEVTRIESCHSGPKESKQERSIKDNVRNGSWKESNKKIKKERIFKDKTQEADICKCTYEESDGRKSKSDETQLDALKGGVEYERNILAETRMSKSKKHETVENNQTRMMEERPISQFWKHIEEEEKSSQVSDIKSKPQLERSKYSENETSQGRSHNETSRSIVWKDSDVEGSISEIFQSRSGKGKREESEQERNKREIAQKESLKEYSNEGTDQGGSMNEIILSQSLRDKDEDSNQVRNVKDETQIEASKGRSQMRDLNEKVLTGVWQDPGKESNDETSMKEDIRMQSSEDSHNETKREMNKKEKAQAEPWIDYADEDTAQGICMDDITQPEFMKETNRKRNINDRSKTETGKITDEDSVQERCKENEIHHEYWNDEEECSNQDASMIYKTHAALGDADNEINQEMSAEEISRIESQKSKDENKDSQRNMKDRNVKDKIQTEACRDANEEIRRGKISRDKSQTLTWKDEEDTNLERTAKYYSQREASNAEEEINPERNMKEECQDPSWKYKGEESFQERIPYKKRSVTIDKTPHEGSDFKRNTNEHPGKDDWKVSINGVNAQRLSNDIRHSKVCNDEDENNVLERKTDNRFQEEEWNCWKDISIHEVILGDFKGVNDHLSQSCQTINDMEETRRDESADAFDTSNDIVTSQSWNEDSLESQRTIDGKLEFHVYDVLRDADHEKNTDDSCRVEKGSQVNLRSSTPVFELESEGSAERKLIGRSGQIFAETRKLDPTFESLQEVFQNVEQINGTKECMSSSGRYLGSIEKSQTIRGNGDEEEDSMKFYQSQGSDTEPPTDQGSDEEDAMEINQIWDSVKGSQMRHSSEIEKLSEMDQFRGSTVEMKTGSNGDSRGHANGAFQIEEGYVESEIMRGGSVTKLESTEPIEREIDRQDCYLANGAVSMYNIRASVEEALKIMENLTMDEARSSVKENQTVHSSKIEATVMDRLWASVEEIEIGHESGPRHLNKEFHTEEDLERSEMIQDSPMSQVRHLSEQTRSDHATEIEDAMTIEHASNSVFEAETVHPSEIEEATEMDQVRGSTGQSKSDHVVKIEKALTVDHAENSVTETQSVHSSEIETAIEIDKRRGSIEEIENDHDSAMGYMMEKFHTEEDLERREMIRQDIPALKLEADDKSEEEIDRQAHKIVKEALKCVLIRTLFREALMNMDRIRDMGKDMKMDQLHASYEQSKTGSATEINETIKMDEARDSVKEAQDNIHSSQKDDAIEIDQSLGSIEEIKTDDDSQTELLNKEDDYEESQFSQASRAFNLESDLMSERTLVTKAHNLVNETRITDYMRTSIKKGPRQMDRIREMDDVIRKDQTQGSSKQIQSGRATKTEEAIEMDEVKVLSEQSKDDRASEIEEAVEMELARISSEQFLSSCANEIEKVIKKNKVQCSSERSKSDRPTEKEESLERDHDESSVKEAQTVHSSELEVEAAEMDRHRVPIEEFKTVDAIDTVIVCDEHRMNEDSDKREVNQVSSLLFISESEETSKSEIDRQAHQIVEEALKLVLIRTLLREAKLNMDRVCGVGKAIKAAYARCSSEPIVNDRITEMDVALIMDHASSAFKVSQIMRTSQTDEVTEMDQSRESVGTIKRRDDSDMMLSDVEGDSFKMAHQIVSEDYISDRMYASLKEPLRILDHIRNVDDAISMGQARASSEQYGNNRANEIKVLKIDQETKPQNSSETEEDIINPDIRTGCLNEGFHSEEDYKRIQVNEHSPAFRQESDEASEGEIDRQAHQIIEEALKCVLIRTLLREAKMNMDRLCDMGEDIKADHTLDSLEPIETDRVTEIVSEDNNSDRMYASLKESLDHIRIVDDAITMASSEQSKSDRATEIEGILKPQHSSEIEENIINPDTGTGCLNEEFHTEEDYKRIQLNEHSPAFRQESDETSESEIDRQAHQIVEEALKCVLIRMLLREAKMNMDRVWDMGEDIKADHARGSTDLTENDRVAERDEVMKMDQDRGSSELNKSGSATEVNVTIIMDKTISSFKVSQELVSRQTGHAVEMDQHLRSVEKIKTRDDSGTVLLDEIEDCAESDMSKDSKEESDRRSKNKLVINSHHLVRESLKSDDVRRSLKEALKNMDRIRDVNEAMETDHVQSSSERRKGDRVIDRDEAIKMDQVRGLSKHDQSDSDPLKEDPLFHSSQTEETVEMDRHRGSIEEIEIGPDSGTEHLKEELQTKEGDERFEATQDGASFKLDSDETNESEIYRQAHQIVNEAMKLVLIRTLLREAQTNMDRIREMGEAIRMDQIEGSSESLITDRVTVIVIEDAMEMDNARGWIKESQTIHSSKIEEISELEQPQCTEVETKIGCDNVVLKDEFHTDEEAYEVSQESKALKVDSDLTSERKLITRAHHLVNEALKSDRIRKALRETLKNMDSIRDMEDTLRHDPVRGSPERTETGRLAEIEEGNEALKLVLMRTLLNDNLRSMDHDGDMQESIFLDSVLGSSQQMKSCRASKKEEVTDMYHTSSSVEESPSIRSIEMDETLEMDQTLGSKEGIMTRHVRETVLLSEGFQMKEDYEESLMSQDSISFKLESDMTREKKLVAKAHHLVNEALKSDNMRKALKEALNNMDRIRDMADYIRNVQAPGSSEQGRTGRAIEIEEGNEALRLVLMKTLLGEKLKNMDHIYDVEESTRSDQTRVSSEQSKSDNATEVEGGIKTVQTNSIKETRLEGVLEIDTSFRGSFGESKRDRATETDEPIWMDRTLGSVREPPMKHSNEIEEIKIDPGSDMGCLNEEFHTDEDSGGSEVNQDSPGFKSESNETSESEIEIQAHQIVEEALKSVLIHTLLREAYMNMDQGFDMGEEIRTDKKNRSSSQHGKIHHAWETEKAIILEQGKVSSEQSRSGRAASDMNEAIQMDQARRFHDEQRTSGKISNESYLGYGLERDSTVGTLSRTPYYSAKSQDTAGLGSRSTFFTSDRATEMKKIMQMVQARNGFDEQQTLGEIPNESDVFHGLERDSTVGSINKTQYYSAKSQDTAELNGSPRILSTVKAKSIRHPQLKPSSSDISDTSETIASEITSYLDTPMNSEEISSEIEEVNLLKRIHGHYSEPLQRRNSKTLAGLPIDDELRPTESENLLYKVKRTPMDLSSLRPFKSNTRLKTPSSVDITSQEVEHLDREDNQETSQNEEILDSEDVQETSQNEEILDSEDVQETTQNEDFLDSDDVQETTQNEEVLDSEDVQETTQNEEVLDSEDQETTQNEEVLDSEDVQETTQNEEVLDSEDQETTQNEEVLDSEDVQETTQNEEILDSEDYQETTQNEEILDSEDFQGRTLGEEHLGSVGEQETFQNDEILDSDDFQGRTLGEDHLGSVGEQETFQNDEILDSDDFQGRTLGDEHLGSVGEQETFQNDEILDSDDFQGRTLGEEHLGSVGEQETFQNDEILDSDDFQGRTLGDEHLGSVGEQETFQNEDVQEITLNEEHFGSVGEQETFQNEDVQEITLNEEHLGSVGGEYFDSEDEQEVPQSDDPFVRRNVIGDEFSVRTGENQASTSGDDKTILKTTRGSYHSMTSSIKPDLTKKFLPKESIRVYKSTALKSPKKRENVAKKRLLQNIFDAYEFPPKIKAVNVVPTLQHGVKPRPKPGGPAKSKQAPRHDERRQSILMFYETYYNHPMVRKQARDLDKHKIKSPGSRVWGIKPAGVAKNDEVAGTSGLPANVYGHQASNLNLGNGSNRASASSFVNNSENHARMSGYR